ncbi:MAG: ABC transporter permease [Rhodospirillales bacterium]|nr:ABC transporter permease [Rhodospirillales bacterium]
MSQAKEIAMPSTGANPSILRRVLKQIEVPYALISGFTFFAFWQIGVDAFDVPAYLLPSPLAVLRDLVNDWQLLLSQSGVTLLEIGLGFVVSIAIALPLAVLFTYSQTFEKLIYPLIVGTQTIPKVAVAPLFLVWFGFGLLPKIIIVTLMTFFPIVINAVVGLKSLNLQTVYLAQSMGASPWQVFWNFRLPNALPSIFAGLKVASVLAVIGAIVAEFVGADSGLGYLIVVAATDQNVTRQFSAIFLLSLAGILLFGLIGYLERRLLPWHASVRRDTTSGH